MRLLTRRLILISLIFLASVSVLILKYNPDLFLKKSSGSFEFVRRGEAMLEKGRYKEAVKNFEKAYRESPENPVIRSNLAHAYSKQGSAFEEEGARDNAIYSFLKSREIETNLINAQDLAIAYSRKAIIDLAAGHIDDAVEGLSMARETANEYPAVSKNLGIFLFNEAVGEHKALRNKSAILLLKEAGLANEDPMVYEALGGIYYDDTRLDDALFYWEKALSMKPDNKQLAERIERLNKEIQLSGKQRLFRSEYFEIRYEKGLNVDPMTVRDLIKKAYRTVGMDLDYHPESATAVFLYSEDNFKDIFKLPDMIRAFYDGNIRMPFPKENMSGKDLERYITHEYTHAAVSAKTLGKCPVWLSEGIAMMESYRDDPQAPFPAFSGSAESTRISLGMIADAFDGKNDAVMDIGPYYILAYSVVKYIVDSHGMSGLRSILDRIAGGQHVMNAIDDEFLFSEKEFNRRWIEYARGKNSSV